MTERSVDVWDRRFMDLSGMVASWSKDPSTKCGAVIIDDHNRVLGIGFNGFPRRVLDLPERYDDRPTKYAMIVHAEANAILNASSSVAGCGIYTTKFPCTGCAKLIIQAGIHRVHCPMQLGTPSDQRWEDDARISRLMLDEALVQVYELDLAMMALK